MKKKSLLIVLLLLVLTLMPLSSIKANEVSLSPYVKVISNPVVPYVRNKLMAESFSPKEIYKPYTVVKPLIKSGKIKQYRLFQLIHQMFK